MKGVPFLLLLWMPWNQRQGSVDAMSLTEWAHTLASPLRLFRRQDDEEEFEEEEEDEESEEEAGVPPGPAVIAGPVVAPSEKGKTKDVEKVPPQTATAPAPRPSTAVRMDEQYALALEAEEKAQMAARALQDEEDARMAAQLEQEEQDRQLQQEAQDLEYAKALAMERLHNAPHDEAMAAEGSEDGHADEHVPTPPKTPPAPPQAPPAPAAGVGDQQAGDIQRLHNAPHDEAFDAQAGADDSEGSVPTPIPTPKNLKTTGDEARKLANEQFDEALAVEEMGHIPSPLHSMAVDASGRVLKNSEHDEAVDLTDSDQNSVSSHGAQATPTQQLDMGQFTTPPAQQQQQYRSPQPAAAQEEEESSSDDEEDEAVAVKKPQSNLYNPGDFASLNVSKEVKDLFGFIQKYTPHTIELDCTLKPFIPDYIPAVGDIDAFLKVPRPDGKADLLGLAVLDEPAAQSTNPAVVKLGLAYQTKSTRKPSEFVESIEEARLKPALIDKWMSDIGTLHKRKPAPTVTYTRPMPDVEQLLQVWPTEFEDLLTRGLELHLPPAQLDVELYQYVKLVCSLLDIPIYQNMIESLHVLFTLYSEFKANQHFQAQGM